MRNFIIASVAFVLTALFGISVYVNSRPDVDPANTYAMNGYGYGVEQIKTEDGNLWNCGIEIKENAHYIVVFDNKGTPSDPTDDAIIEMWEN